MNYFIPTDASTVELVARAIAKNRMLADASTAIEDMIGVPLDSIESLEETINKFFEVLWNGESTSDERQRQAYRDDALSAINAINLRFITSGE